MSRLSGVVQKLNSETTKGKRFNLSFLDFPDFHAELLSFHKGNATTFIETDKNRNISEIKESDNTALVKDEKLITLLLYHVDLQRTILVREINHPK